MHIQEGEQSEGRGRAKKLKTRQADTPMQNHMSSFNLLNVQNTSITDMYIYAFFYELIWLVKETSMIIPGILKCHRKSLKVTEVLCELAPTLHRLLVYSRASSFECGKMVLSQDYRWPHLVSLPLWWDGVPLWVGLAALRPLAEAARGIAEAGVRVQRVRVHRSRDRGRLGVEVVVEGGGGGHR